MWSQAFYFCLLNLIFDIFPKDRRRKVFNKNESIRSRSSSSSTYYDRDGEEEAISEWTVSPATPAIDNNEEQKGEWARADNVIVLPITNNIFVLISITNSIFLLFGLMHCQIIF
jgi:hypothetical protein